MKKDHVFDKILKMGEYALFDIIKSYLFEVVFVKKVSIKPETDKQDAPKFIS